MTASDSPIERLGLESVSPMNERLALLQATFPEAFEEGNLDPAVLMTSLGERAEPEQERFGLHWPGKAACTRAIQEPSVAALLPMEHQSVDWDNTRNAIIEGDNLEVLKLLQRSYHARVKLIYIDPPYNTGKEFIYPDNFKEGLADYLRYSGQAGDDGLKIAANVETGGRYHSKWLSMMYPACSLRGTFSRMMAPSL